MRTNCSPAVWAGIAALALASTAVQEANAQVCVRVLPRCWSVPNPVIHDSGTQLQGLYYDPYSGQATVTTERTRVHRSVLDPYRNYADPYSYRYVDRIVSDRYGNLWRERGTAWSSFGRPHSDTVRERVTGTGVPGLAHHESVHVLKSARGRAMGSQ